MAVSLRQTIINSKNFFKKVILWYLVFTFRHSSIPRNYITRQFPGNSGYRFLSTEHSKVKEEVSNPVIGQSLMELPTIQAEWQLNDLAVPLINTSTIIVRSDKAQYKYHLEEMYKGTKALLGSLGSSCLIKSLNELENLILPPSKLRVFDFMIIDSEISHTELNVINSLLKQLKFGLRPRLLLLCYDLWRPQDANLLNFSSRIVDGFLHMDPVMFGRILPKQHMQNAYLWPVARFWQDSKVYSPISHITKNSIYFSGSVRQIDRREILETLIRRLRNSSIETNFNIFDTLIPRSIPKKSDYLEELNSNSIILSMAQKSSNHWILTGRTWETLIAPSGGLLLQQEGPNCRPLAGLLTSGVDYLSFSSPVELNDLVTYVENNQTLLAGIANSGRVRVREIFSTRNLQKPFLS